MILIKMIVFVFGVLIVHFLVAVMAQSLMEMVVLMELIVMTWLDLQMDWLNRELCSPQIVPLLEVTSEFFEKSLTETIGNEKTCF